MEKRRFCLFVFFICLSFSIAWAQEDVKDNSAKAYYEKSSKNGCSSCKKKDANLPELELNVILSSNCKTCSTGPFLKRLENYFSKIKLKKIDIKDAKDLVEKSGLKSLPIYFIQKETVKLDDLEKIKNFLEEKDFGFVFIPQFSGMTYLLDRQLFKGKIDLFLSIFDKDTAEIINNLRQLNPRVHFLAIKRNNEFIARGGLRDLEEIRRAVCIQKYYPNDYFDYLLCRANNIQSTWWDECVDNVDYGRIRQCSLSEESDKLLEENLKLVMELNIFSQATVLLENKELFQVLKETSAGELEQLLSK